MELKNPKIYCSKNILKFENFKKRNGIKICSYFCDLILA